ncbi:MAG: trehalose-phosphatase [Pseudomonadota bacterium]
MEYPRNAKDPDPTAWSRIPDPAHAAIFLDFDGTLTEIVARPEDVAWTDQHTNALNKVVDATGGATAVVSGRRLNDLERLLDGFQGTLCGGHGAEMQGDPAPHPPRGILEMTQAITSEVDASDGVWVEAKPGGFTVHYRAAPAFGASVKHSIQKLIAGRDDLHLFPAKMAWEVRPAEHSKGGAIERLMRTEPFLGRCPVFAGDDTTDFDAFATVAALGGITVAVGNRDVTADVYMTDPSEVRLWLFGKDGPWDA